MFSHQEILDEVKKIQYLYGLKREIRYAQTRDEESESVAEHIYGMHICAQYFLPLENPENTWDKARIYEMITFHDIDEIETGDIVGYLKSEDMLSNEGIAARSVMQQAPSVMQAQMEKIIASYETQSTVEARFVKAIDKIESCIHIYSAHGKKTLLENGTTLAQHKSIKDVHTAPFPYISAFNKTLTDAMHSEGFFS